MNAPFPTNVTFREDDDLPFGDDLPVVANKAPARSRFSLTRFADDFNKPIAAHLIRNILPAKGLVLVTGKEKSGKTFLIMSLMMSIASDELYWAGRKEHKISDASKDGIVVYVSAEGHAGFRLRKMAYAKEKGWSEEKLKSIRFFDVQAAPNLRNKAELNELIDQIKLAGWKVICVVVDTLARTINGNENDGEVMSEYVNSCSKLSDELDTLVILAHHLNKSDDSDIRGSSVLPGAIDAEIRVVKEEMKEGQHWNVDNVRSASLRRCKDMAEAEKFYHFTIKPVLVGTDAEGNDVISCIAGQCSAEGVVAEGDVISFKSRAAVASQAKQSQMSKFGGRIKNGAI